MLWVVTLSALRPSLTSSSVVWARPITGQRANSVVNSHIFFMPSSAARPSRPAGASHSIELPIPRQACRRILTMAIRRRGRVATTLARAIAVAAACLLGCADARAQDTPNPDSSPVRIFIDCTNTPCDGDFFRTEMTFVDHVRDRQTADVHILLTGQSTGSGG